MKRFIILVAAVLTAAAVVISGIPEMRQVATTFISENQFRLGLAVLVVVLACLVGAGAHVSRTNPVRRDVEQ